MHLENDAQKAPKHPFFFNCGAEIEKVVSMLSDNPALTIMLGPPSSGETRLLAHCCELKDAAGKPLFYSLNINLRGVLMDNEQSFIKYFLGRTKLAAQADDKSLSGKCSWLSYGASQHKSVWTLEWPLALRIWGDPELFLTSTFCLGTCWVKYRQA